MSQTRRDFLRKSGCALSMAALATQVERFGLINALAQKGSGDGGDYKALICIYLNGGNDGNNLLVPNHNDASISNYAAYNTVRGPSTLAIPQANLLPITVPRMGGLTYGLHPSMVDMQTLWNQQKLAIVSNVGTLVQPMTRTTYQNNSVPKPLQLFSHSDQVAQSQASISNNESASGWGGRTADHTGNLNVGALIPMITSIAGSQLFTAGAVTKPLAVNPAPTALNQLLTLSGYTSGQAASDARRVAFDQLRTVDQSSNVVRAAQDVTQQAINASIALNQPDPTITAVFPNTTLGNQLRQVAKFLAVRNNLAINRQIFFCSLGGYDTHANELPQHVNLYNQVNGAMKALYDETVVQGIADKVTTFTLSDFGRTFLPSGTGAAVGTDHAWGNHMLVMGGAVLGGDFYGMNTSNGTPYPTLQLSGPDDTDNRGRWIPTTSVDQYAATLATWFGLSAGDLNTVFPFLSNFGSSNLGFLS